MDNAYLNAPINILRQVASYTLAQRHEPWRYSALWTVALLAL